MKATEIVQLRAVTPKDLPHFFQFQRDPEANQMAAFTAKDPNDREVFDALWQRILGDEGVLVKTILFEDKVVGNLLNFQQFGHAKVGYWIDRVYWGRGIATQALNLFLDEIETRPLYARVAQDNIASIRVLEKCGFEAHEETKGFANARGKEIIEYVMKLE